LTLSGFTEKIETVKIEVFLQSWKSCLSFSVGANITISAGLAIRAFACPASRWKERNH
jgi:hypothetical protein